ncbi:peptidase domain-containing ABC transporter [Pedobacter jeongneungensis]|uniref:Peptidase domain-containing ABC transporter n=2 Tax=Pedobacter jeongneungensis TaxID=947309 RepID=A0ABP8BJ22_9SPHI
MVANFHGYDVPMKTVKELCSVTRMGVSVKDILDGGRKLGLQSNGLKLLPSQLTEIPLPAILFWKQDHFVVLHKISKKGDKLKYHIADPGYGKTVVDEELLTREWLGNGDKGVTLVFQREETAPVPISLVPKIKVSFWQGKLFMDLKKFVFANKFKYIISFVLLIVGLMANWLIPILFKKVIDQGILAKSLNLVVVLLLAQFFLFLGNFVSGFVSDLILTKSNFKLAILLKTNFLKKLIRLPVNYFDTRLNSDTLQRMSDLSKVQSFLTWKGISFMINVLNLLAFSLILVFMDKLIFSIFFLLSGISIIWIAYFLKKRATLEYSMFIRQSENSNNLYEFIMNMPEIKVNQAENTLINKITSLQKKLNELELSSLYLNMYQLSGANFILKLKELITIAVAAYFIINGKMSVGTLLSISYIMGQLSSPIINIINNIRDAQDAAISNRRVEDVYTISDEAAGYNENNENISVEDLNLDQVGFKYPGSFNSFVLKNLTLTIPKNKITAIVGTSGSGKTTLMKLLLLYYNPSGGSIVLGDRSLAMVHPDGWRKKCGVVLQDGHIFAGTIMFNIVLCDPQDADMDRLNNAIRIACLGDLMQTLPLGYNTKIGNVGMQLSGGQKQRVLIARAVYKNPEFIFFDEATSSLDANTEKSIMNNLSEFFKGKTVVVVAHRLSTVKNADQIIVLEKGELIEKGTHEELLKVKDKYFSLVKNQLELGS